MKRPIGLALVVIVAGGASAVGQTPVPATPSSTTTQAPPADQSLPIFRSGVDLVALTVTVTDSQQNYITGLARDDFAVFEDGVQQDLSFFAADHVPMDLALLIDTSSSMQDKMELVRAAAIGFINTIGSEDRAAVIAFNTGMREVQSLTSDRQSLETAIRNTNAQGGTSLYNAVYVTLKELVAAQRQTGVVRRQAIVVLSDGEDTSSLITFDDVMESARRSGVTIYTIAIKSPYLARRVAESGRRYYSQSDFSMRTLAQETGARAFFPLKIDELPGIYGEISNELSRQYAMGYTPKNTRRDGGIRRLVVRVLSRPDARPRTRSGYLAASVAPAVGVRQRPH
ncbi:MAG: VWA domain-containing protein [Acidobacteria bacterium]|nr:VWA domain-containing protein [Acidobacteriota bacterium]MBI3263576.1 VWA domain-containing protein [Acidobacteriota bacterium]